MKKRRPHEHGSPEGPSRECRRPINLQGTDVWCIMEEVRILPLCQVPAPLLHP